MADARQLWQTALGELQLLMTRANFETWFAGSQGLDFDGSVLRVGVHSPFTQEALATRFTPLVRRSLAGLVGHPVEVRYEIVVARSPELAEPLFGSAVDPDPLDDGLIEGTEQTIVSTVPFRASGRGRLIGQQVALPPTVRVPLNPRYTFASYVVGSGNRLAHAATQAVVDAPGQAYNPLFIYGGVGLGKTHLLHAIGNAVVMRGLQVLYVSSETFTNDLINAIRDHRTDDFRAKYRRASLLLIDDIQFIASKERTQEEFFHTFNAIHDGGGQIVLSSDRPPNDIPTLEGRLRSRFEWGLIADIQLPDLETRIAILRSKLSGRSSSVPAEVLEFIAQKAQSSVRELEGSLNRVLAYAQLHHAPLSVQLAVDALRAVAAGPGSRSAPAADDVLQAVVRYHAVSLADLRGKQRDRRVVVPRQIAMYLLREDARLSTPEIGRRLGGRDHSTVMHGIQKIAAELLGNSQLKGDVQAIRELLASEA